MHATFYSARAVLAPLVCALALAAVPIAATESGPVRSIDNIPPAPATEITALNTGNEVLITWTASADDAISYQPFGDTFVPAGGLNGYRIYRSQGHDATPELVGTVVPGVTEYSDNSATAGLTYVYSVRPFDNDNETVPEIVPGTPADLARIASLGGGPPDVVVTRKSRARLTLDTILDLEDEVAVVDFRANLIDRLATRLGVSPSRITITGITLGSIIVEFEIADVEGTEGEPAAEDALATLATLVADDPEALGAPVLDLTDESTEVVIIVPQPLDADGIPIVGWFTRAGTQVGLDDFFLFAENFNLRNGDAGYDGAYDIVPNSVIDFDDFFRFAEDFGKTVTNAAEIRALIGS